MDPILRHMNPELRLVLRAVRNGLLFFQPVKQRHHVSWLNNEPPPAKPLGKGNVQQHGMLLQELREVPWIYGVVTGPPVD